jgi:tRNA-splicing ligase RtcB
MNARQLLKLGVPEDCIKAAILCIQKCSAAHMRGKDIESNITACVKDPEHYKDDSIVGDFAKALIDDKQFVRKEPIVYKAWGEVELASRNQMLQACSIPSAVAAAIMPDSHPGFGICIGGVLALENAVCPFAVGVDIACRMKMSILNMPINTITDKFNLFKEAIEQSTMFGVGKGFWPRKYHPVMDEDWNITPVTREYKDKAWDQLGSSGSGNHFVDVGILTIPDNSLGFPAGEYVAIMTHSGSRGTGGKVCDIYSGIAQSRLPTKYKELGRLAWLDMDTDAGIEYFLAMQLMGRYAAANHDLIHRDIAKFLHVHVLGQIENHHNFAWEEEHFGKKLYIHRKGATPAGKGVLGVIPGSMGTPAYVVRGLGNPNSLCSASHGAGRKMSRKAANEKYSWQAVKGDLEKKGIIVLSAGADESPGSYKNIDDVMAQQSDLVEPIARFDPKIVMMDGSGSKAED